MLVWTKMTIYLPNLEDKFHECQHHKLTFQQKSMLLEIYGYPYSCYQNVYFKLLEGEILRPSQRIRSIVSPILNGQGLLLIDKLLQTSLPLLLPLSYPVPLPRSNPRYFHHHANEMEVKQEKEKVWKELKKTCFILGQWGISFLFSIQCISFICASSFSWVWFKSYEASLSC